jgi:glyoxylase-like metal-dependent hydrolase (beta-lactamase superfamily II)
MAVARRGNRDGSGPRRLLGLSTRRALRSLSGMRKPAKRKNWGSALSDATDRWTVGNVTITRVVEFEIGGFPPGFMFAGLTEDRVKSVAWLHPNYADPDGTIRYPVQAYIIESQGRRIIVDTCVSNDKDRNNESWNHLKLPFLERLTAAGYPPESIDVVLCTHLHLDHVGWNTRWDGGKWVPTFPNARYLFGRVEWEHWSREVHSNGDMPQMVVELAEQNRVMVDSVLPIVDAGLQELVETDHRLTEEVMLFSTPGHSPGHVSVAIRSQGREAAITGDVIHNPIQLADPGICANFDFDQKVALATRQAFIDSHADRDVLVLGTHFPTPAVGHIVRDGEGWGFTPEGAGGS